MCWANMTAPEAVHRALTPGLFHHEEDHVFLHNACLANCAITLGPRICTCKSAKPLPHHAACSPSASDVTSATSPPLPVRRPHHRNPPQLALTLPSSSDHHDQYPASPASEQDDNIEQDQHHDQAKTPAVEDYRAMVEELRYLQRLLTVMQKQQQERDADLAAAQHELEVAKRAHRDELLALRQHMIEQEEKSSTSLQSSGSDMLWATLCEENAREIARLQHELAQQTLQCGEHQAALRSEHAREVAALRRENEELSARVSELSAELADQEQTLQWDNVEITTLRQQVEVDDLHERNGMVSPTKAKQLRCQQQQQGASVARDDTANTPVAMMTTSACTDVLAERELTQEVTERAVAMCEDIVHAHDVEVNALKRTHTGEVEMLKGQIAAMQASHTETVARMTDEIRSLKQMAEDYIVLKARLEQEEREKQQQQEEEELSSATTIATVASSTSSKHSAKAIASRLSRSLSRKAQHEVAAIRRKFGGMGDKNNSSNGDGEEGAESKPGSIRRAKSVA